MTDCSYTKAAQGICFFGMAMTTMIGGALGITGRISPALLGKINIAVAVSMFIANGAELTTACFDTETPSEEEAQIRWHIVEFSVISLLAALTMFVISRLAIKGILTSKELGYGLIGTCWSGITVGVVGSCLKGLATPSNK